MSTDQSDTQSSIIVVMAKSGMTIRSTLTAAELMGDAMNQTFFGRLNEIRNGGHGDEDLMLKVEVVLDEAGDDWDLFEDQDVTEAGGLKNYACLTWADLESYMSVPETAKGLGRETSSKNQRGGEGAGVTRSEAGGSTTATNPSIAMTAPESKIMVRESKGSISQYTLAPTCTGMDCEMGETPTYSHPDAKLYDEDTMEIDDPADLRHPDPDTVMGGM